MDKLWRMKHILSCTVIIFCDKYIYICFIFLKKLYTQVLGDQMEFLDAFVINNWDIKYYHKYLQKEETYNI